MNSDLLKQEHSKDTNSKRENLIAGKKCEYENRGNFRRKDRLYGSMCL